MKLRDAASWLPNHLDRVERLGAHLGPNLVQLPPRWKRNVERLDEFLLAAPPRLRWAVELRDPSWLHDDVFDLLAQRGAALCLHDLLAGPPVDPDDVVDVRAVPRTRTRSQHKYHGRYGGRRLAPVAKRLRAWADEGTDVYAYFNNDYEGHAVEDARWLRERLVRRACFDGARTPQGAVRCPSPA